MRPPFKWSTLYLIIWGNIGPHLFCSSSVLSVPTFNSSNWNETIKSNIVLQERKNKTIFPIAEKIILYFNSSYLFRRVIQSTTSSQLFFVPLELRSAQASCVVSVCVMTLPYPKLLLWAYINWWFPFTFYFKKEFYGERSLFRVVFANISNILLLSISFPLVISLYFLSFIKNSDLFSSTFSALKVCTK